MTSTSDSASTGIRAATTAELRLELDSVRQTYQEYRTLVRDRAIEGYYDSEWPSLEDLNATLCKLGLEPYEPKRTSHAVLRLDVPLTVDTGDNGAARRAMARLETVEGTSILRDALASSIQTLNAGQSLAIVPGDRTYAALGSVSTTEG